MNRIELVNSVISKEELDNKIVFTNSALNNLVDIRNLVFEIIQDTSLEINYLSDEETKLSITFLVKEGVNFKLTEIKEGKKFKTQVKFYLAKDSHVEVTKFYDVDAVRELDIIYLEKEGSKIDYNFKTISTGTEKYDIMVYHNSLNTTSKIKNNGVNVSGSLIFNVSSFVPKGNRNCLLEQSGKIINLTNNKCQINPNLLIDENDVEANHSANICKFSDDEMFYLQSRGLNEEEALNLLIKGFLLDKVSVNYKKIENIINRYWRWNYVSWWFWNFKIRNYLFW